jgi:thiamine-phosphate pyrophosphorylase
MQFILISTPDFFPKEALIINKLLEKYSFTFHLRKPSASPYQICNLLNEIHPVYYSKIVIHNHVELTQKFGLKGVHASSTFRKKIKNAISTSFHSLQEVEQMDGAYEYAFLSPIFPSISKADYQKKWQKGQLQTFLNQKRKSKLIALGGIDQRKMRLVQEMNFDGYAFLGSVWNSTSNPEITASNFLKIWQEHKQILE